MAGSLCDACRAPGRCCTGFTLTPKPVGETPEEVDRWAAEQYWVSADRKSRGRGLPFRALYRLPNGMWRFWCPNLLPSGRCGDYENRPSVCRDYEPGEDRLCAEYLPSITAAELGNAACEAR
jgi:Fe-S-cluster containining protein